MTVNISGGTFTSASGKEAYAITAYSDFTPTKTYSGNGALIQEPLVQQ